MQVNIVYPIVHKNRFGLSSYSSTPWGESAELQGLSCTTLFLRALLHFKVDFLTFLARNIGFFQISPRLFILFPRKFYATILVPSLMQSLHKFIDNANSVT